jgi:hypothetical protein
MRIRVSKASSRATSLPSREVTHALILFILGVVVGLTSFPTWFRIHINNRFYDSQLGMYHGHGLGLVTLVLAVLAVVAAVVAVLRHSKEWIVASATLCGALTLYAAYQISNVLIWPLFPNLQYSVSWHLWLCLVTGVLGFVFGMSWLLGLPRQSKPAGSSAILRSS